MGMTVPTGREVAMRLVAGNLVALWVLFFAPLATLAACDSSTDPDKTDIAKGALSESVSHSDRRRRCEMSAPRAQVSPETGDCREDSPPFRRSLRVRAAPSP